MTAEANTTVIGSPPTSLPLEAQINEQTANAAKAASGQLPKAPATAPQKGKVREVLPIKPSTFGLTNHQYRKYAAIAAAGMNKDDLHNPLFWSHVANQLSMFDEVRVLAEDGSWVADVIITFKHANNVKATVTNFTELDKVSYDTPDVGRYRAKQKGVLKWCIEDTETGENVFEKIATQSAAYKQLEEYIATLNR